MPDVRSPFPPPSAQKPNLASTFASRLLAILPLLILFASLFQPLYAQAFDDGVMMPRRTLFAGDIYSNNSWDHYWEGHLNRVNGNLGTVTTQTDTYSADYGVTNRLNVFALVPYVWTDASQGVLHGMQGYQDITLAAKYAFIDRPFTKYGGLRALAAVSGAIPMTNYEPGFQPLSIGNQSKRISARLTLHYQTHRGWFATGTSGYTWRHDVTLDTPYYYTDGQFFLTNQVGMPEVFDYTMSGGYQKGARLAKFAFSQQRTQGGGDIRRQDAPFISNHINFSKIGVALMYPLPIPKLHNLAFQFGYEYIVDGRNIGQSTTYTTSLFYTLRFPGSPTP
jgi:hypothetical protein